MELLVPGVGILAQDGNGLELLIPGGLTLAEDEAPPPGLPTARGPAWRGFARNPYLFQQAADVDVAAAPEPETLAPHIVRLPFRRLGPNRYVFNPSVEEPAAAADVPDGGSGFLVVWSWDDLRLTRASRLYYQARRDDTVPEEPHHGPPHPPRGRPFRRDGGLGFEEGARYRPNRYIWNASVETLEQLQADTLTPFLVRTQYRTYLQNRHTIVHYYFLPPPLPLSGFQAGWADDSTVTINARRIDRGVIA